MKSTQKVCEIHGFEELDAQQKRVIRLRFNGSFDHPKITLESVGRKMGLGKERIRQIQNIALMRLRNRFRIVEMANEIALQARY